MSILTCFFSGVNNFLTQPLHGTAIYACRSVGVVPGGSMGRHIYSSPMECLSKMLSCAIDLSITPGTLHSAGAHRLTHRHDRRVLLASFGSTLSIFDQTTVWSLQGFQRPSQGHLHLNSDLLAQIPNTRLLFLKPFSFSNPHMDSSGNTDWKRHAGPHLSDSLTVAACPTNPLSTSQDCRHWPITLGWF